MHCDWDIIKKRLTALWNRQILDRCCISVQAPKKRGISLVEPCPADAAGCLSYWTDCESIFKRSLRRFENTYFAGDAFPLVHVNLGAAGHAGFFKGSKWQVRREGIWFEPFLQKLDPGLIEFDSQSFLYQRTMELVRYLSENCDGSFFIGMPDTCGVLDALASLRGSEELLTDMYDKPDAILDASLKIEEVGWQVMADIFKIIKQNNNGGSSIGWLATWAPGFHGQLQCDISVMLSPEMFEKFAVPQLAAGSQKFEYPLYHLDGIEQIRHLDSILAVENLKMIQWTQVAGQPPATSCIDALKKIQAAGKSLLIKVYKHQVEELLKNLSSRGLFLVVYDAADPAEADSLVQMTAKLTHD